jgi:hypothetical protein
MFKFTGKVLSLSAAALFASTVISSAASLDDLVKAAKAEGQLTTIALPHDWCGYGDGHRRLQGEVSGLTINELNPDAGSGDEVEAIKANKDNTGPQAPDVIDVGLSFGPTAKKDGLIQPYKVSTWDSIPDSAKDADGFWTGDYYGVLAFEVNKDMVKQAPADWADLLKPEFANAVALAGDPRTSNQAIQGVYAAGLSTGAAAGEGAGDRRPRLLQEAQRRRQFRAVVGKAATLAQGQTPILITLGLQRARRPRHVEGQSARRRHRAEDRRRRRCLRAGDQRLRAASERGQALDGIPLLRRRPARLAEGLLPPDPLQRSRQEWQDPADCWPSCRRRNPMPRQCSRRSTSRLRPRKSSPRTGTVSAPTSSKI